MKNSKLSLLVAKKSQNSHKISEFDFIFQKPMLYVLDKVTKKTVYIIVDIDRDNISLSISLAKCLISQKVKERRVYYTCNELVSKFTKKRRQEFTPKDVYENQKSEEVENTKSININVCQTTIDYSDRNLTNQVLNFYGGNETSKLNIAS